MANNNDPKTLAKVMDELVTEVGEYTRMLLVELVADLTEATPRATGWAANNWAPKVGSTKRTAEVEETGAPVPADLSAVLSAPAKQLAVEGGIVGNGVPYITALNEGSSTQAPAAFVQTAMAKSLASVRRKRRPKK